MMKICVPYFVVLLTGVSSEIVRCGPDTCPPTATCKDTDGYIACECPVGKVGFECTEDDPCLPNPNCPKGFLCYGPCEPNIVCLGATGYPHCRGCVPGYTGLNCTEDVDECTDFPNPCANNGTCINVHGDFKCFCTEGWTGKECLCQKGTECDVGEIVTETTTPSNANVSSMTLLLIFFIILSLCVNLS